MLGLCSHCPEGGTGLWWQICLEFLQQEQSAPVALVVKQQSVSPAWTPYSGPTEDRGAHCVEAAGGGGLDAIRDSG